MLKASTTFWFCSNSSFNAANAVITKPIPAAFKAVPIILKPPATPLAPFFSVLNALPPLFKTSTSLLVVSNPVLRLSTSLVNFSKSFSALPVLVIISNVLVIISSFLID